MAEVIDKPAGDYETAARRDDRLELRLWLRLLTCTNLIEREIRQRLREEFDTTLPRFDILAQLDRAPQGLTMGELSRRLMVSHGNVTGLVDRLVAEGLVERTPVPEDRRILNVRLTTSGKALFDTMTPPHLEWVVSMMDGLTRDEMKTLYDLLAKLKTSAGR